MAGAIAGAATALLALAGTTKDYRKEQAMLSTAFETAGGNAATAKEVYNDLYRVLGDGGKATEAAQHLAKLTTNEKDLAQWTKICQGVYASFGESIPIEGLTEAINHTAKVGEVQGVLADALEWSGINMDEFNEQLFWCNSESEREKLIRETLNGAYGEAAEKYEENAAEVLAQNEAQAKLTDAMAKLGEATAPILAMLTELLTDILTPMLPKIQEFAEKYMPSIKETLSKIAEAIGKILTWIADNWEFVSTLAIIIAGISTALSVMATVMGVVNAVAMASPITWIVLGIVAAIAALIAIVILLIKYWDEVVAFVKNNWQGLLLLLVNPIAGAFKLIYDNSEVFRNFINGLVDKVKTAFSNMGKAIKEKFNAAAETIKSIINKIKGFFKFEWSLPKLKVPKFSITPSGWKIGDLLKGSIPKLGITWNARGGVFEKPTVMNYGNSLQGLGEQGTEAIVPLENNLGWLDKIATMLAEKMGVGTPITLTVDGKVFAQTTIKTLNQNTRQTGKLGINLI